MFDYLTHGSDFEKGLFVTLFGMLGVFVVLIVFYAIIKLFIKVFPYKPEENGDK